MNFCFKCAFWWNVISDVVQSIIPASLKVNKFSCYFYATRIFYLFYAILIPAFCILLQHFYFMKRFYKMFHIFLYKQNQTRYNMHRDKNSWNFWRFYSIFSRLSPAWFIDFILFHETIYRISVQTPPISYTNHYIKGEAYEKRKFRPYNERRCPWSRRRFGHCIQSG